MKKAHYDLHKYSTEAWEYVQDGDRVSAMERFEYAYRSYEELIQAMKGLRYYIKRNPI